MSDLLPHPVPTSRMLDGDLPRAWQEVEERPDALGAWSRGWVHAAAGRYGAALRELAHAASGPDIVAAAACVTRASLLRQVGLHGRAHAEDAAGLVRLTGDRPGDGSRAAATHAEVLAGLHVGLVADAVGAGLGGPELDRRLGAAAQAVEATDGWRQRVRLGWVAGEIAMLAGSWDSAGRAFGRARSLAAEAGGRRHEAKSAIFAAAAAVAAGDLAGGADEARSAGEAAQALGALPLVWPALLVQADAAAASDRQDAAAALRQEAAGVLGPLLTALPDPLHRDARGRPPAVWLLPLRSS